MNDILIELRIDSTKMNIHKTRYNQTKVTWKPWTQVFKHGRGRAGGWDLVQYIAKTNNMLPSEFARFTDFQVYSKHILLGRLVKVNYV